MAKRICAIKKDITSERYSVYTCAWYRRPENKVIGNLNIYCDQVNNTKMGCRVHRILKKTQYVNVFINACVTNDNKCPIRI